MTYDNTQHIIVFIYKIKVCDTWRHATWMCMHGDYILSSRNSTLNRVRVQNLFLLNSIRFFCQNLSTITINPVHILVFCA